MREVIVSDCAWSRIVTIHSYLFYDLMLSEEACMKYIDRMESFLHSLCAPVDYALCRFKEWRKRGWRCTVFDKAWIIAYEVFDDGVLIHDIRHAKTMKR